jgi:hypothetical protein
MEAYGNDSFRNSLFYAAVETIKVVTTHALTQTRESSKI